MLYFLTVNWTWAIHINSFNGTGIINGGPTLPVVDPVRVRVRDCPCGPRHLLCTTQQPRIDF